MSSEQKSISVIIPCFNEEKYLASLIEDLLRQDYPKEKVEIIFADGRSSDHSREIISSYQKEYAFIRLIDNPHRFVPHALNVAIRESKGEIIIRMDAHSQYPHNYWSTLVKKLDEYQADNVGGAWNTQPGANTLVARAIVFATSHPLGIGNASYRLGAKEEREVDTVPYGCFHRSLFERIGFFDEDLLRNQDDEFNGRIKKNGGKIVLIPSLEIKYFARENYKKLWRMFYQYGFFKPLVNKKLGSPATLRQFAPPALILALILPAILSWIPFFSTLWIAIATVYVSIAVIVGIHLALLHGIALYPYLLLSFPVIHFAYGLGYIFGIFKFLVFGKNKKINPPQIKENR